LLSPPSGHRNWFGQHRLVDPGAYQALDTFLAARLSGKHWNIRPCDDVSKLASHGCAEIEFCGQLLILDCMHATS
jgi:hypothetical protein